MNLITPLAKNDPLLRSAGAKQDLSVWSTNSIHRIPPRLDISDIPLEGSCEERRARFEQLTNGIQWVCADAMVENGVKANVHVTTPVRIVVPKSAALLDVLYFHRSRGDWRQPVEVGVWHANMPDTDLQWMKIHAATVSTDGEGDLVIEALCDNWSAELRMFCAIGVQYRAEALLW
jgi:hypothetical protein